MIPPQTPFLLRNAVTSSGLCGVPLLPKLYKCKRPQHVPEQTYRRISLRRSMLRSFLYPIQLVTPQGYIASQVTIVFNSELCYTWSIKKRAINVSLALGSSQNYELMMPNVLRCARPYTLGIFIVYLNRSLNRSMILTITEIR